MRTHLPRHRLTRPYPPPLCFRPQYKDACEELARGEELRTLSPNIHLNVVIEERGKPMVCEIQIYHLGILALKHESHLLYSITRAGSVEELIRSLAENNK